MALDEVAGQAWTRKHDDVTTPVVPSAPRTVYPRSLEDCIEICRTRKPHERIRAAGSHWALSEAAIADTVFVETHDPTGAHAPMDRTLYNVVPGALSAGFKAALARQTPVEFSGVKGSPPEHIYPVHFETGKRVCQVYSELDAGDTVKGSLARELDAAGNNAFLGAWGFATLGGAGGQTVFGALNTGTHGGDFDRPPIADSVLALHLVADGGHHWWIEPERLTPVGERLTDPAAVRKLYGDPVYGGPSNFTFVRDNQLFDAVLVSAGRFGIVYSVVLAAVPQYGLHQRRRITRGDGSDITWEDIKGQIADPESPLYEPILDGANAGATNRFLQVAVCLTPHAGFTRHLAGITQRWNCARPANPATGEPAGRAERRGDATDDPPVIDGRRASPSFPMTGSAFPFDPDPQQPGSALPANFLEQACSNGNFMVGVLDYVATQVNDFVATRGAAVGATIAAVAAVGAAVPGVGGLLLLLAPLAIIALALVALVASIAAALAASGTRFGETMNAVRSTLLDRPPAERVAGLFVWQMIVYEVFKQQQANLDFEAISYAVMDGHDYRDRSCNFNIDSAEIFFDAADPKLLAFVDALIAFETAQEMASGRAIVGYASLRFMQPTRALLGMQRRFRPDGSAAGIVCAVEVAGLRDVRGTTELIDYALRCADDPNFDGVLHWGQRHTADRAVTERHFGDSAAAPSGDLWQFRAALSRITAHGRLDGFSSDFTRRAGLEVVQPRVGRFDVVAGATGQPIDIAWDCRDNPAGTQTALRIVAPSGASTPHGMLPLAGTLSHPAGEAGTWRVELELALGAGALRRTAAEFRNVHLA